MLNFYNSLNSKVPKVVLKNICKLCKLDFIALLVTELKLLSHQAVCKTALATLGLLILYSSQRWPCEETISVLPYLN